LNFRSSLFLSASLLVLLPACATVPPSSVDAAPEYDPSPAYPHWAGRPVTWSKLADIERWLDGDGPRQYPEFVPTAELELAEGRLSLARKEASGLPQPVLASRLSAAEAGFEGLLARSSVKPALKLRAERGLEEIQALRGQGVAKAPSAASAAPALPAAGGISIQPRTAWKASPVLPHRLTGSGAGWNRITIHHSAKYSKEIGTPSAGNVGAAIKDIQTVHMRDRGWGDIGYHFLIDPTGRIWQGRLLDWQGAHAQGSNNVQNIGVCLLGDFNHERPDPRALESLERLVDALCERHRIAQSRVYGHQKFAATECPGDSLMAWISRYSAGATH
jgi:hypothetical protein